MRKTKTMFAPALAVLGLMFTVAGDRGFANARADLESAPSGIGKVSFDISAQPLNQALNALAQQADLRIVFDTALAEGVAAPAVNGSLTVEKALEILLTGSKLTYQFMDERTVAVSLPGKVGASGVPLSGPGLRLAQADGAQNSEPGAAHIAQGSNSEAMTRSQDSPQKSDSSGSRIEEIVVTAQKREEKLQDVPMSIAVVTSDDIERRGLVSAEDYLRGMPGVNMTSEVIAGGSIIIRGIETRPFNSNFFQGASVATYFGETPTTTSAGPAGSGPVDLKLVDIERVEVLRGPQGTAFGSSAIGGAVRTIPVAPKLDRVEGKVAGGYSQTSGTGGDNFNVEGVINLPVVKDKLALRATAYRYEDSGYYRNVAGSDPAFQAALAPFGGQPFAFDEDELGASQFTGGRVAALAQLTDALKVTFTYLKQETEVDGMATAVTGPFELVLLQPAPTHNLGGRGSVSDTDIDLATATMEYDFGWSSLLATYSYINSGSLYTLPFSLFGLPWPVSQRGDSGHRAHSGEIRLTSQLDGPWNFIAGLFAEDLEDVWDADLTWYGTPESNVYAPNFQGIVQKNTDLRNLTQKAAFAEVSWEFLPRTTFTGGVRAYDYERTGHETAFAQVTGLTEVRDRATEATGTTFRANLSHKFTDTALVYAGWSQGFRLGTATAGLRPELCDLDNDGIVDGSNTTLESTRRVDSDTVDNYEIGGKFTLLNQRLVIAADVYRMDWSDLAVGVQIQCLGLNQGYVTNAASARSEGIEFQANAYLTKSFRVDVGGSWVRARLREDVPAQGWLAGSRLPGSPEGTASLGLQYDFTLGASPAFVRADSIYVGPFNGATFSAAQRALVAGAGDYVKVDAAAGVAIGRTNITLFVRNLTDADEFVIGGDNPANPFSGTHLRPRTVGLRLSHSF